MDILYDPKKIEKKWQKKWEKEETFKATENSGAKKYYLLEMFPYPSGKIHMGHVRIYTIGDVIARYKRICGYNVLHPMGWDAFGLPAENAAIANNTPPAKWTYENIEQMRYQLKRLGFSYDWNREITTCTRDYYRWEQWLFIKMLEKDMVYRKESFVNWCGHCNTVLANEQVNNDMCWRCGNSVTQKKLWQWFFRITDYAEDLLVNCEKLTGWPKKVTLMQKNWIGKSFGMEIKFSVLGTNSVISVFTTRPETIYGTTFISLAAEHPMTLSLSKGSNQYDKILKFVKSISKRDKSPKVLDTYEKEGVFIGVYCINPINQQHIPVYVVDFAVMEYGTGAIMSVPAHDQRDFEFAKKYNLPIKVVIDSGETVSNLLKSKKAFTGEGTMINSEIFDGFHSKKASQAVMKYLEKDCLGYRTVSFRLKDWGISRQRYWGTPIPIVYCDLCGSVPVKEEDLPIVLPEELCMSGKGSSPLLDDNNFIRTSCPSCGSTNALRETDTMDTFVESSWYFLRFCSPGLDKSMFDKKAVDYWMPVDQYVGGIEHAILHLLYSRYLTRVLNDIGLIDFKEPFLRILTQGMVCKETFKCLEDGFLLPEEIEESIDNEVICSKCNGQVKVGRSEKMSKSKKNVIDPAILINRYGADTVRLFCLFAAPPEKDLEWNEQGVEGIYRFLKRVWRIVLKCAKLTEGTSYVKSFKLELLSTSYKNLLCKVHETIKKVTMDIENKFHFNTAISSIMELVNVMYTTKLYSNTDIEKSVLQFSVQSTILLLYPMAPHFCEELWSKINNSETLLSQVWPKYDENAIMKQKIIIVVQVNGKLRSRIEIEEYVSDEDLKALALSDNRISEIIKNKTVKNIIVIKNKLVSIVLE